MNYIEHFLILISTVTGCVLISAFASLVAITIEITSYSIRSKICKITVEIKGYKSIIKKKKKKHDEILFLTKSELNSIEILISNAIID